ncbi:MAG: EamA family transporter [Rhizobiaceae bacterium]
MGLAQPTQTQNYIIILCVVSIIALGQMLFKTVGTRLGTAGFEAFLHDFRAAGLFILALALYGIATIGWVLALRNVPLSTAYLFMALSFVIVPMMAWWWLGEPLSVRFFMGSALILVGIVMASG